ncbi:MAG: hypothetical protein FJ225_08670 [Lentisphaerae bacterium]|nr:hypothetical protein [Lentisphaerota bacterium]
MFPLELPLNAAARKDEAIVGGQLGFTEEHYKRKLAGSIRACIELLKPDRWASIVFQHWDTSYFETILAAATGAGADLRAAVTQEREVIWSMHKKKNRETMLAGEMILSFYKPEKGHTELIVRESGTAYFDELLGTVLSDCGDRDDVTSQFLFNRIVLEAWKHRSLSQLAVTREAFAEALRKRGWHYDAGRHAWTHGVRHGYRDLLGEM